MVTYLDTMVGNVVQRLEKHGLVDNTIIFFTSDNGPHSEGGNNVGFFDANGPVTGIKRAMYDGGIRVPMVVQWPGKIKAGATTKQIAGGVDLMATAAEIAGVDLTVKQDGISFLPTLLGDDEKQIDHDYLYWEFYEQGSKQALRMGDWKAIRRPLGTGPIELYNVVADVAENVDVASQNPELVSKIRGIFESAHVPIERWQVSGKVRSKEANRTEGR